MVGERSGSQQICITEVSKLFEVGEKELIQFWMVRCDTSGYIAKL